jgi:ribosomal protein L2
MNPIDHPNGGGEGKKSGKKKSFWGIKKLLKRKKKNCKFKKLWDDQNEKEFL